MLLSFVLTGESGALSSASTEALSEVQARHQEDSIEADSDSYGEAGVGLETVSLEHPRDESEAEQCSLRLNESVTQGAEAGAPADEHKSSSSSSSSDDTSAV